MVPKGTLLKLLKKALHPENRDIAIFQAFVQIAHAATWYARLEKIGADLSQRFSFTAFQAVFGRTISFGHHHLARAALLKKIRLPKGLLSHDNWDTVLLDQMGYRVAFCPDVYAFDEAPTNYLEARARSRRWSQGTLWPRRHRLKIVSRCSVSSKRWRWKVRIPFPTSTAEVLRRPIVSPFIGSRTMRPR